VIKVSFLSNAASDVGQIVFPLHTRAGDRPFEKQASTLLPEVAQFVAKLRPVKGSQYVLVNAMGASEYYGSNINSDAFPEAALVHKPDGWTGIPDVDKLLAKDWAYGFPTFYNAKPFAHHRNKNAERGFGEIELASWNPRMKRVELVIRVDEDKCNKFGGAQIWERLRDGKYLDVSMGSRVPFDTCSICLNWDDYRQAQKTFDPKRHKHPGEAVLAYHKKLKADGGSGIRGLSITRADYCEHMRKTPNKIQDDGRRVFVYNDYPRFFDISFVFVGADKTAKVMWKIAGDNHVYDLPGADLAEHLGYAESGGKMASVQSDDDILKEAFLGKSARNKKAEIEKKGPPPFDAKAVPILTKNEPTIPREILDELAESPMSSVLSGASSLGMILRPREFQRIVIVRMGMRPLADEYDDQNIVFSRQPPTMGPPSDSPASEKIMRLLSSLMPERTSFQPSLGNRTTIIVVSGNGKNRPSSHSSNLLHKIGAAYSGYRKGLMEALPGCSAAKLASAVDAASMTYAEHAYWNEVGV
jgi:hypothetical protein